MITDIDLKVDVNVYTTPICPWCKRVKDFLSAKGVPFTEINVAGNQEAAQEMIRKSGQMGVPVTDVDGRIIVGFDRDALENALNARGWFSPRVPLTPRASGRHP